MAKKKKKAFGGYKINFKKVRDVPLGKVFGAGDLAPPAMTKKLWAFIKKKRLAKK